MWNIYVFISPVIHWTFFFFNYWTYFHHHVSSPAAAAAKSLQLCLTLCDPIDDSPPDSPVPGILQARTLEWVAISFSNAWKWKVKVKLLSRVGPSATPWTAAYQAPPSMGSSRQEYWSGVPLPSLLSLWALLNIDLRCLVSSNDWKDSLDWTKSGNMEIKFITIENTNRVIKGQKIWEKACSFEHR